MINKKVDSSVLNKVRFFIPAFHVNAHKNKCIEDYHPKNCPSIGVIDGETVERMWSQLAVFSFTTRNMSQGNRKEQLEDAITALRERTVLRMSSNLRLKANRALRSLNNSTMLLKDDQIMKVMSDIWTQIWTLRVNMNAHIGIGFDWIHTSGYCDGIYFLFRKPTKNRKNLWYLFCFSLGTSWAWT